MLSSAATVAGPDTTGAPSFGRDDRLRTAALGLLRSSGYRPLRYLDCEVRDGRAVLSGVVPSFYLKQLAQALLLRLGEIQGVNNLLEVLPGGPALGAAALAFRPPAGGGRSER
jgi:hypothetical protein